MPTTPLYCREVINLADEFDPRSFRTKTVYDSEGNIKAKILIGCPKGHWDNVRKECCYKRDTITGKCTVTGTRAVSILHYLEKGYCPPGVYAIINRKYTGGKIVPFTTKDFIKYREEYLKKYKQKVKKLLESQKKLDGLDYSIYNMLNK